MCLTTCSDTACSQAIELQAMGGTAQEEAPQPAPPSPSPGGWRWPWSARPQAATVEEAPAEEAPAEGEQERPGWRRGGVRVRADSDADGASVPLRPEDSTAGVGHAASPDAGDVVQTRGVVERVRGWFFRSGSGQQHHMV